MVNKKERYVDLHIHTTNSDGELTAEQIIAKAQDAGLSAIALTDHNCFAIQTPMRVGELEVIPGAEFSTIYAPAGREKKEVHIVGLFFNGVSDEMIKISQGIDKFAYEKVILAKLNSLGIDITLSEVLKRNPISNQCNRYPIADVLVDKGYASDRNDAMDCWIGNYSPYYINPGEHVAYMSMKECVDRISKSGLPVLAHPFHYRYTKEQIEALVSYYRSLSNGPMAIEVYYRNYTEEQTRFLEYLADKYQLLRSGGSDRHKLSQGFKQVDHAWLERMKEADAGNVLSLNRKKKVQ